MILLDDSLRKIYEVVSKWTEKCIHSIPHKTLPSSLILNSVVLLYMSLKRQETQEKLHFRKFEYFDKTLK